ncbi:MAG: FtsH protease modulator HflK [Pseudomonadota bacterium]|jgi:membrane protease subunit HflK
MAWNEPGGKGNSNDPWGSNNGDKNRGGNGGGNKQPPDLDEAIKQLNKKLGSLFGKKPGAPKNSNDSGLGSVLGIIVGIAVVVALFSSVYTLDEQERGVVLRMGKYLKTEQPGLRFKIPLIDQVTIVKTTAVRTLEIRERMLTEDENIVEVELNAQYRVADPVSFALRVDQPEHTLQIAAQSALRHEAGSTTMDEILTSGRAELADKVQKRLQEYLVRYRTGMELTNVNIKDARPPEQVRAAFDDVQVAKQDKERIINEAQAYANAVVPESRGRATRQLEEAQAYKEQVVAHAQGEAERFNRLYAEYRKAPGVTRERLYIDAISALYANSGKVLVDVKGGNNNMLYLPLDKIMQAAPVSFGGLNNTDISRLTDQVLTEARNRQPSTTPAPTTIRREGR